MRLNFYKFKDFDLPYLYTTRYDDKLAFRINSSKLTELLSTTVPGEPAIDDEEGGHPDEKQEALVEEQEEEGRWLLRPWRCHG